MVRLTAPNGSTVNVSEDKAKRLTGEGYKPAEEKKAPKATRKRDSSDESEK